MKALRTALLALTVGAFACGGSTLQTSSPFKKNWQSDGGVSISKVEERLRGAPRVKDANIAIGVTKTGLVAEELTSKARWSYAGKVGGVPSVAGELVVFTSGNDVVALQAKSGKPVWKISADGRKLRGAGDDGSLTLLYATDEMWPSLIARALITNGWDPSWRSPTGTIDGLVRAAPS